MRFLTARRRHPATRPLLLVLALLVVGGLYSFVAPTPRSAADGGTSAQVEAGRQLYAAAGCASCHGMNGEGTSQGPSLVGVGSAAVDFQVSTGRMPLTIPGAQAPEKQNVYTQQEIDELAAYVASFGPGVAIPDKSEYDPEGLTAEQLAKGGELFRANCSACHNFAGHGGALPNGKQAPALTNATDKEIWEALRTGPGQMPQFPQTTLTNEDVRSIIGYLDTLHSQSNQGGFTLGGLGPVSEGLWVWLIGIGILVLFAIWITARGVRSK